MEVCTGKARSMAKGKARGGAEAAAKRDEEVRRTMERLEEGVRSVFESARYRRYLAVMSRLHSYSANNCLLIAMQRPDATLVAGYRAWQDKFGRQVRKGERGMRILSPVVVKEKGEGDDVGEARDGGAGDGPRHRLAGFRLATVFDVSQTEGRELPILGVDELTGGVARYEAAMRAVSEVSRYPVSFEDVPGGAKGFFSRSEPKRIVIQKGMSQAQTLKTAIHELAHSVMHDSEPKGEGPALPGRATREVQAESVAFVVSSWLGLDTGDYSFGYVAGWSEGKDLSELRASLDEIRGAVHGIIGGMEQRMAENRETEGLERVCALEHEPDAACRSLSERAAIARKASARDDRAPRLPDRSDR